MPRVGNKHFAYTPAGKAAAKQAAKKSGQKVQYMAKGGAVPTTEKRGSGGVMPQPPAKKQK